MKISLQRTVLERKQIWQCATPKSASTYLNRILNVLWKNDCCFGSPVPFFDDRCQEPDILVVFNRIFKNKKPWYSGHLHQRYTTYLHNFFLQNQEKLGGGVIVQTRDLKDTIVSMRDHIEKDYNTNAAIRGPWFVSLDKLWPKLNEDEKYRLITYYYAFWHRDFTISWKNYSRRIEISYESLIKETVEVVYEICKFFTLYKSTEEIEQAIASVDSAPKESRRMNVGIAGRGDKLLPNSVKSQIDDILSLTE